MNTALTEQQLEHLLEFIGYGRLDSDVWFLGMEENNGGEENIRTRINFQQVEDLIKGFKSSDSAENEPGKGTIQDNLDGMCYILLKLEGKEPDVKGIRSYRADYLGRSKGVSLLCELMPIPREGFNEWGYEELIPQFRSQDAYFDSVLPRRLDMFRELLEEYHPKIVIAYGKDNWQNYKDLFQEFKFSENGEFLVGWDTDTVIVLSDYLKVQETHENLDKLVQIIRENALSIETIRPAESKTISLAEQKRIKKEAAKQAAAAKRKPSVKHNPADPYCVCAYCLGYEATANTN